MSFEDAVALVLSSFGNNPLPIPKNVLAAAWTKVRSNAQEFLDNLPKTGA